MTTLQWSDVFYQPVTREGTDLQVGITPIDVREDLDLGDGRDAVSIERLNQNLLKVDQYTSNSCRPQLAYHVFAVTRRPSYIESYFPIVKSLDKEARRQFHEIIRRVMLHRGFDLQLRNAQRNNVIEMLPSLAYLVAGHIAEIFFYRRDILERLFNAGVRIWLYADQAAFVADGGVAGGCYNPQLRCVQLVVSRLFEGFNQPTAGVAPFLHEFGHLLDYFDAAHLRGSAISSGWLPGLRISDDMSPSDSAEIFTAEARSAFVKGKRIEMQRYDRLADGEKAVDLLPIGHPYVFQNNSEFIAGYLEMFFRNPHYFATQNPDLYDGFSLLLRQDPRQYWETDFPFYVEQNRAFYLSGQRPQPSGLYLEND